MDMGKRSKVSSSYDQASIMRFIADSTYSSFMNENNEVKVFPKSDADDIDISFSDNNHKEFPNSDGGQKGSQGTQYERHGSHSNQSCQ